MSCSDTRAFQTEWNLLGQYPGTGWDGIVLPILEDYIERLQSLHRGVLETIEDLPPPALDWVPGEGMNSLAVLAVHVAGSTRYWIGDVAGQHASGRDRDAEFQARGLKASQLEALLTDALDHSQHVIAGLTPDELEETRVSSRDGRPFTVSWCLAHALEHMALHLGHMQLTRQLWHQERRTQSS
jgi:uncharacterized damage-inducible protein DinB